jgi:hypothetical protein
LAFIWHTGYFQRLVKLDNHRGHFKFSKTPEIAGKTPPNRSARLPLHRG